MKALRSPLLADSVGVVHAFFTRHGGVSEGIYASLNCGLGSQDDPARVRENLTRVAAYLSVDPAQLVTLKQTHSVDVRIIEHVTLPQRPQADALVTNRREVALGITGADCPTVLFADTDAGVIGAAHAGWRGAFHGVLETTVAAMQSLGARCEAIVAGIGPGIQQASYEVSPAFQSTFVEQDRANARFFHRQSDRLLFDLPGYIQQRLLRLSLRGVDKHGHDTFTESDLFSYRRSRLRGEPDYGRQLGTIVLRS